MELLGIPISAVRGQQLHVLLLRGNKQIFVSPQGVVCVEGYRCNVHLRIVPSSRSSFKFGPDATAYSFSVSTFVNSSDGTV
jgi:hypothetical protein